MAQYYVNIEQTKMLDKIRFTSLLNICKLKQSAARGWVPNLLVTVLRRVQDVVRLCVIAPVFCY